VEAWIHDPTSFRDHVGLWPRFLGEGMALVVGRDDPVEQVLEVTELHFESDSVRTVVMRHRYASPCELDLMGQSAGFRLEHRWSDWSEAPFTGDSPRHVSVYRLDGS
jgi:hypothetical protein